MLAYSMLTYSLFANSCARSTARQRHRSNGHMREQVNNAREVKCCDHRDNISDRNDPPQRTHPGSDLHCEVTVRHNAVVEYQRRSIEVGVCPAVDPIRRSRVVHDQDSIAMSNPVSDGASAVIAAVGTEDPDTDL